MRHFLRGNDEEEMDVPINLRFDYGDLTERLNAIEALNAPFFNRVSPPASDRLIRRYQPLMQRWHFL